MRALEVVGDVAAAGGAEGLDGEDLALLHAGRVVAGVAHDGDGLAAVDAELLDVVAVEVADALDGEGLRADVLAAVLQLGRRVRARRRGKLDLVALHDLLDGGADVRDADVDPGRRDAGVGRGARGVEERLVVVLEREGEGGVDDAAVDVRAEVDLDDVVLLQHDLVPRVGRVVRRAIVDAEAARKPHARDQTIAFRQAVVARERAHAVLDVLGDFCERLAGLGAALRVRPDLAVHFGGVAVLVDEVAILEAVEVALFFGGGAVAVLAVVGDLVGDGVRVVWEELGEGDARWIGLRGCGRGAAATGFFFLLGLLLFLLLLSSVARGRSVTVGYGGVLVVVG